MGKMVMKVHPHKLHAVIRKDPRYRALSFRVSKKIESVAIVTYNVQQRKDNEHRTSQTTPPKYISSFRIHWHSLTATHRVSNHDPGWHWVEFGSHAGGKTPILRYRPLGRALDIVAAGGG